MKTLMTLNWGITGLYGILILYLLVVNNGPNNDPAGTGMLGGLIFVLLFVVSLVVFLNLRDSRMALISASVIGGLPLLLGGTSLFYEGIGSARSEKDQHPYVAKTSRVTALTDSAGARQTVLDFLHWYKANLGLISQIDLVNQEPGKNYSVNSQNAERYLIYLKSSELLTADYLNEWRTFFQERQAGFLATPQHEGPPTGFDYDLVMLTQDVDMQMDSLDVLTINSVKIHQDQASVNLFLLEDYEFQLVRLNNRWLINEILNKSAE